MPTLVVVLLNDNSPLAEFGGHTRHKQTIDHAVASLGGGQWVAASFSGAGSVPDVVKMPAERAAHELFAPAWRALQAQAAKPATAPRLIAMPS